MISNSIIDIKRGILLTEKQINLANPKLDVKERPQEGMNQ